MSLKQRRPVLARLAITIALVIPCFWQPSIQSQDLASHVYNVWLAQQIRHNKPANLEVVVQPTNFLFDALLEQSIHFFGFDLGPKIAMAVLVTLFFWASSAFVRAAAGTRFVVYAPLLAMAAYGWVFHMGLANFYLSTALGFLYLALVWRGPERRKWAAAMVLILAAAAHVMPAIWAAGLSLYKWVFGRARAKQRLVLFFVVSAALPLIHLALRLLLLMQWEARQLLLITGTDQLAVFGYKYLVIVAGTLYLWGYLIYQRMHATGVQEWRDNPILHCFAITALAVVILPDAVQLPNQPAPLTFLAQRMSLWLLVLLCGLLPAPQRLRVFAPASLGLAALYFSFLYADVRALNVLEQRMGSLVAKIPEGSRLINSVQDASSRIDVLLHIADRVCLGRCFSYANYEPASGHFRVRAMGPNPWVLWNRGDIEDLEHRSYLVTGRDLPLYQIRLCLDGHSLCLHELKDGELVKRQKAQLLPNLW